MDIPNPVFPTAILFCRVGGCLMTAPGFSSERVPVQFRLYLALAVTLVLAPAFLEAFNGAFAAAQPYRLITAIFGELLIGVSLGLLARFYFFALETLATSVAMTTGLGNVFGAVVTEEEPTTTFSAFVTLAALALIFATDLHLEIIRAISLSYETAPVFADPRIDALMEEIARVLTQSHLLALRICSPFLLFGLVVNVALGVLARLTPQLQIFFVSGPLVIFLGLSAFFALGWDFFAAFVSAFGAWLQKG
ncbi:MAG: flagellar biosynthetic protein FliR [Methylocystis sp.]|uniref:flagellar biosynthetic protein FliR n=1 Tax=Methylocystis sp. TaxID=1911079 RepID=UPI003DA678C5